MVRKKVTTKRDFFKDRDTEPSTPRNRMPAGGPRRAVFDFESSPVVPPPSTSRRYQPSSSGVPTPSTTPRAVPQRNVQHEVVVPQRSNLYHLPRPRPRKRRAKPGAKAGEAFLITIFDCMNRAALHARCVTVMLADLNLVRWILIAFNAFNFG